MPDAIIESARIDGAGPWRIFFTLVIPLSTPALVTVLILDAVATWNEFLFALIMFSSDANKTIPVGLLSFQGQFSSNNTGLAAGILIAVLPDPDRLRGAAALDRRRPHCGRHEGLISSPPTRRRAKPHPAGAAEPQPPWVIRGPPRSEQ